MEQEKTPTTANDAAQDEAVELTSKQRQYLKGLAHPLNPLVQIGREGMSDGVITMISDELTRRELLKVKISKNSGLDKKEAAQALAVKTAAALVQLIGKTVILYRPNPELDRRQRIRLPT